MDPRYLSRLQEEQRKAITETDARIDQLKQFKTDYTSLQDRLKTLPDKVTHDVMVPFGKMAFMQGQLVHTNEILVLLGDNWFVERSAKQAVEIAGRRVDELDKRLKDLEAQQKLLEPRLGFTSDLQAEIDGQGELREIVEDYEEAKERLWDEQHRENMRKYRQEMQKIEEPPSSQNKKHEEEKNEQEEEEENQEKDSSLWSRLDELEIQETERGELNSTSSEDDEENAKRFHSRAGGDKSSPANRRVSWADTLKDETNVIEKSDDDSDDDDDDNTEDEADNEDDNDEKETPRKPVQRTITFKHSPAPKILPLPNYEAENSAIQSPSDIYRLVCPKSILKKTIGASGDFSSERSSELNPSALQNKQNSETAVEGRSLVSYSGLEYEEEQALHLSSLQQSSSSAASSTSQAFTGLVVEKSSDLSSTTAASDIETPTSAATAPKAASTSTSHEPAKRMSKFKASRLH